MSMSGNDSQSIIRTMEMHSNEESQSSIISSTSNTIDGSTTKKRQKKMDMGDSEGYVHCKKSILLARLISYVSF